MHELYRANNLALIAINEAYLMHKWHSFRPLYAQCQQLPTEFPNTPIMILSATVTPDILVKLIRLFSTPVIEKGSMHTWKPLNVVLRLGKSVKVCKLITHLIQLMLLPDYIIVGIQLSKRLAHNYAMMHLWVHFY